MIKAGRVTFKIDSNEAAQMLLSPEVDTLVKDVSEAIKDSIRGDKKMRKNRYTVERNPDSKTRITYNIADKNEDAFFFEIKTKTLQYASKRKVKGYEQEKKSVGE